MSVPAHAEHDPLDLLDVDADLDATQRQVRDTVAVLVRDRLEPELAGWFESGELPMREIARELGRLGLLGMHLDGYGCAGMDAVASSPRSFGSTSKPVMPGMFMSSRIKCGFLRIA